VGHDSNQLSDADIRVIRRYTEEGVLFNECLRKPLSFPRDTMLQDDVARLQAIIVRQSIDPPATLYRGLVDAFAGEIDKINPPPGSRFRDPAFSSTSRQLSVARKFASPSRGGILLLIDIDKPIPGLDIAQWSHHPGEHEVVLASNITYEVISGLRASGSNEIPLLRVVAHYDKIE
jgi:ADP-ribosyltransferase exoenzyme